MSLIDKQFIEEILPLSAFAMNTSDFYADQFDQQAMAKVQGLVDAIKTAYDQIDSDQEAKAMKTLGAAYKQFKEVE